MPQTVSFPLYPNCCYIDCYALLSLAYEPSSNSPEGPPLLPYLPDYQCLSSTSCTCNVCFSSSSAAFMAEPAHCSHPTTPSLPRMWTEFVSRVVRSASCSECRSYLVPQAVALSPLLAVPHGTLSLLIFVLATYATRFKHCCLAMTLSPSSTSSPMLCLLCLLHRFCLNRCSSIMFLSSILVQILPCPCMTLMKWPY